MDVFNLFRKSNIIKKLMICFKKFNSSRLQCFFTFFSVVMDTTDLSWVCLCSTPGSSWLFLVMLLCFIAREAHHILCLQPLDESIRIFLIINYNFHIQRTFGDMSSFVCNFMKGNKWIFLFYVYFSVVFFPFCICFR